MCIYLPDQLTRHPAGAASTKKISRFYIPDIFQTLRRICCLLRMWRLWPSFSRVGGGLPPHPLMLPGARQPSLHQTIVSSVQIKFNELRYYIFRFTSRKKNIFVIFCVLYHNKNLIYIQLFCCLQFVCFSISELIFLMTQQCLQNTTSLR